MVQDLRKLVMKIVRDRGLEYLCFGIILLPSYLHSRFTKFYYSLFLDFTWTLGNYTPRCAKMLLQLNPTNPGKCNKYDE